MVTLVLIVLAIIAIAAFVVSFIYNRVEQSTSKKFAPWTAPLTWFVTALLVMTMGIVVIPNVAENEMIGNASEVIVFEDGTLYHNEKSNEYFCIAYDDWNPKKSVYKIKVSKELAEDKIENYNQYKYYREKTQFLFDKEN